MCYGLCGLQDCSSLFESESDELPERHSVDRVVAIVDGLVCVARLDKLMVHVKCSTERQMEDERK